MRKSPFRLVRACAPVLALAGGLASPVGQAPSLGTQPAYHVQLALPALENFLK